MSSNILIKLSLDNGDFSTSIKASKSDLKQFKAEIAGVDSKIQKAEKSTRSWGASLRDAVIIIGMSRHALMNLDAVFLSLPRSIITASGEIERMTQLMRGLSNATGNYGEVVDQADKGVNFIFDMANRAPFDVSTLTDSFVKFRSVGLDPTNGSMQALIDSVAKFGGSKEQLHRASIAIQQMAGKGVISMEELRQQLGEAVPDAIKIMARGVGLSMGELTDKISKGAVASTGALQAMFRQMAIENSGAALEMSETWSGLINRLESQITIFKKKIGEAGYFEEVKEQLRFIIEEILSSPEAAKFAKDLGESLAQMVRMLRTVINTFYEYRDQIILLGKVTAAYFLSKSLLSGGFDKIKQSSMAASAAMSAQTRSTGFLIKATDSLIVSTTRAVASTKALMLTNISLKGVLAGTATVVRGLGAAMWGLVGGPIGAAALALTALIPLYESLRDKHLETMKDIEANQPDLISKDQMDALEQAFKKYEENLRRAERVRQKQMGASYIYGGKSNDLIDIEGEIKKFEDLQKETGITKEKYLELVDIFKETQFKREMESASKIVSIKADQELRNVINQYKKNLDLIIESSTLDKEKEKEVLDRELKEKFESYFEEKLSGYKKNRQTILDQGKDYDQKELALVQSQIDATLQAQKAKMAAFDFDKGGIDEQKASVVTKQNEKLSKMLKKLTAEYEKLAEKVKGGTGELEKFKKIVETDFKDGDRKIISNIEAQIVANDKLKEKIKANTLANKAFEKSLSDINKIASSISTTFAKRENNNPFMKDALRANDFKVKLQQVQAQIGAMNLGSDKILQSVEALEKIDTLMKNLGDSANSSAIALFKDSAEDIRNELLPATERIEGQYQKNVEWLKEWKDQAGDTLSGEQETIYYEYIAALNAKKLREMETPVQKLVRTWRDTSTQINNIWASALDGFVSTLADGLVEGELRFDSFAKSFAKMIVQMKLQAAAAGVLDSFFPPSYNPGPMPVAAGGGGTTSNMVMMANGGIVSSQGSLALKKYARGGIANRPQLALFGEGSQAEAYVPLPDGRTIPVTVSGQSSATSAPQVHFNLINQSGHEVEAAPMGDIKFDGEKMVLDVVLKGVSRPGKFRDSMKGALR